MNSGFPKTYQYKNGTVHNTQIAVELYGKGIVDRIGICADVKSEYPELYDELVCYLMNHHQWLDKSKNMKTMGIKINKSGQLEIRIFYPDGGEDNISRLVHNMMKPKFPAYDDLTKKAMRRAVQPQIDEFRKSSNENICMGCDKFIAYPDREVDHKNPDSFQNIADDFLKRWHERGGQMPNVFEDLPHAEKYQKGFLSKDTDFREEFEKYHRERAKLRILCKTCNRRSRNNSELRKIFHKVIEAQNRGEIFAF